MENYAPHRLTNDEFLQVISLSFKNYLNKGTSRSTEKLKPLHGAIAKDIAERLGPDYDVWAQGYSHDKEACIDGRYLAKKVDITVKHGGKTVAGIAAKFVMQNYSQNSNNYFEGMLGETANIRCAGYPYFQVFIVFDKMPYYNRDRTIRSWETFTEHNVAKYAALSHDNADVFFHTPNKTLVYVVHLSEAPAHVAMKDRDGYLGYYRQNPCMLTVSDHDYGAFDNAVILNDYETFIDKVYHTIKSL